MSDEEKSMKMLPDEVLYLVHTTRIDPTSIEELKPSEMTKYKDQFPGVFFSLMESFLFCLRHSIHPFPHRLETEYIAVSLSSVVVVSL